MAKQRKDPQPGAGKSAPPPREPVQRNADREGEEKPRETQFDDAVLEQPDKTIVEGP